jgi:transcription elongation factor Elf1
MRVRRKKEAQKDDLNAQRKTLLCPGCGQRLLDSSLGIRSRLFTPVKGRKPDYYVKCRHCGAEVGVTKLNSTDSLRASGPGADRG